MNATEPERVQSGEVISGYEVGNLRCVDGLVPIMEALGREPIGTVNGVLDLAIPLGKLPPSIDGMTYGELKDLMNSIVLHLYGPAREEGLLTSASVTMVHEVVQLAIRKKEKISSWG